MRLASPVVIAFALLTISRGVTPPASAAVNKASIVWRD